MVYMCSLFSISLTISSVASCRCFVTSFVSMSLFLFSSSLGRTVFWYFVVIVSPCFLFAISSVFLNASPRSLSPHSIIPSCIARSSRGPPPWSCLKQCHTFFCGFIQKFCPPVLPCVGCGP